MHCLQSEKAARPDSFLQYSIRTMGVRWKVIYLGWRFTKTEILNNLKTNSETGESKKTENPSH